MIKIPRSLTIKGQKYKIYKHSKVIDDDGNERAGLMCPVDKIIWLEKESLENELKSGSMNFVVHEISHAIINELNIELSHDLEEVLVKGLAIELDKIFDIKFRKAKKRNL
jgi:hypothetical protein